MELLKVVNARQALDALSDRDNIGAHLAYWMTKFIVKTKNEHDFYASEMSKLFEKYARKNSDGTFLIPAEEVDVFNSAIKILNETDVEDPGIRFSLSELSAELKLSMKQMYPLLDFIDEEK